MPTPELVTKQYSVGIVGGAGYTAGELLRILVNHPNVVIRFVHSTSNAHSNISDVHQDLLGDTELKFSAEILQPVDVLFLCVGHGDAKKFLENTEIDVATRIIDLSQDYRIRPLHNTDEHLFVYGLPELNRREIQCAQFVANPGCFATAIQLGLLPLAKAGVLGEVYTTGITGSTGAGQQLSTTSHYSWRANNIQAYKSLQHQHVAEIEQSLITVQSSYQKNSLHFVPWRGNFTRGIFISSTIPCAVAEKEVRDLFTQYYANEPFVVVSDKSIALKQVVNTNKALVQLEFSGTHVVVHSIIDNLVKGASGQAVHNMNIMLGLPETTGLQLKATGF